MHLTLLPSSHKTRWVRITSTIAAAIFILISLLQPQFFVSAATSLTISPITWNVIGLDSNNVNIGPNDFPVGARICNTGGTSTTVTSVKFFWDDGQGIYTSSVNADPYINLRDGSYDEITNLTLASGRCTDGFFEVIVNRNSSAYNHMRSYHVTATDPGGTVSTQVIRELFVEHLISQNRNSTNDMLLSTNGTTFTSIPTGGVMNLSVGSTYWIKLVATTATQGYNQLEDFISLPDTIFRVLSVESHYSADSSAYVANSSDKLYADACLWDGDPTSLTYRSCIGSDGKVGGSISTTYKVLVISGAGSKQTLNSLIYDFSGSSYHYNSDYSTEARIASITSPLTLTKSFSPVSISSNGTAKLSINISNSSSTDVIGVGLTDPLPVSPSQMRVDNPTGASTSAGCLSPTYSPINGDTSITFTGGVAANSTCTIGVNVTAATIGTYINTIGHLFINGSNTNLTASANLTVAASVPPGEICSTKTLATWTFPAGFNVNTPSPISSIVTATASTTVSNPARSITGNPLPSWTGDGFPKTATITGDSGPYYQFSIATNGYSSANISVDYKRDPNWSGGSTPSIYIWSSTSGGVGSFSNIFTDTSLSTTYETATERIATTTGATTTYFRINAVGAVNANADLEIDNVIIKGTSCEAPTKPTITKAFSPNPIPENGTSTLTFTLNNTNTTPLTGAAFSDSLPYGLQVASTPAASTNCTGATFNPSAASTTLTLAGGTIPAWGSCTVQVNVTSTSAGIYHNNSGFISTIESGTNSGAGGSASATLTVLAPPKISKSFSPNPIYSGEVSKLTFRISNPNVGNTLTGVAFTDNLPTAPGNMLVANTPNAFTSSDCGSPVFSPVAASSSFSFSGGTIPAGGTCIVTVDITATLIGNYSNTSSNVISANAGDGISASAYLGVQTVHPAISILKQVSTSASGPWTRTVNVIEGGDIYYRLTIENTGDVPLSPVSVSDPTLDTSSCAWPATLPVGTSSVDPTFNCLLGPITSLAGSHANTATAHGTYTGSIYNSSPSTATYVTTSLTLVKTVTEDSFSAVGNIVHYSYIISNTSDAALSLPAAVSDTKTSVICPVTDTSGNNDSSLDPGENIICTATYIVTAFDMSVGSVTNTAFAMVDSVRTNNAQAVIYRNLPDLVVAKNNNTDGFGSNGTAFTWTLTVSNKGVLDATFTDGQVILTDQLPASGAAYGIPVVDSFTGITNSANINCSIDGSFLLSCMASGYDVTVGATSGSFAVQIETTPNTIGSLVNTVSVDPDGNILEGNEGNNNGSDAVTVISGGAASMTVEKSSTTDEITTISSVAYSYLVTNTGNVTLTGISLSDDNDENDMSCSETSLAPQETMTCSATHTVTQDELNAGGTLDNQVTVSSNEAVDATDELSIPITQNAIMTVEKSSTTDEITTISSVAYSYLVTNTGNVTLTGISLSDDNDEDDMSCSETSLAPQETMTCSATHTVTQDELNAGGTLDNQVTVSSNEAVDATDELSISIIQNPLIGIAKRLVSITKVSTGTFDVTFELFVKNYGNVNLTDLQVTDDLVSAFPLPTTFEVQLVSSSDFSVNWTNPSEPTDFNGNEITELLANGVNLNVGAEGKINLVVRVIPADAGPFENNAVASGLPPQGKRVTDNSSDGIDPDNTTGCNTCVNGDKDPTNNELPTTVDFGADLFDPPFGIKIVNPDGLPLLRWTMVWINNANLVAENATVHDPIPFGTLYSATGPASGYPVPVGAPFGSTNVGVTCKDSSDLTSTTLCYYEGPSFDHPLGQIIWAGTLGPDFGVTNPALAFNKVIITFNVSVIDGVTSVDNEATIDADRNGDGDTLDQGEQNVASAAASWVEEDKIVVIPPEAELPGTGFAPGKITRLNGQTADNTYADLNSNPWLEIPTLSVRMKIVGIPLRNNSWDVSWLWNQAGWLEGSAYPSWAGNSILTSHVFLSDGSPGPFVNLHKMVWGQRIYVHVNGKKYVYEVQSVHRVLPSDRTAFAHEDSSWLTLVTCQGYDGPGDAYLYRILVRARLIKVEQELTNFDRNLR